VNINIIGRNKIYNISEDSEQYILSEEKIHKTTSKKYKKGDKYYTNYKFFPTLPGIFNRLLELEVKESDILTLEELVKVHTETREWLEGLFKGLTKVKEKRNEEEMCLV